MAGEQRELNFPRGKQLRLLRDWDPPTVYITPSQPVSGALIKAVLHWIDDYGGGRSCWPGIDTLARTVKRSEKSVRRVCQALKQLGLMDIKRKRCPDGKTRNHFVIFWDELEYQVNHGHQTDISDLDQTDNGDDQTDNGDDQTDNGDQPSLYRKRQGNEKEASPPPPSSQSSASGEQAVPEWAEAEEVIFEFGVKTVDKTIRIAKGKRLSPADVIGLTKVCEREHARYKKPGAALAWAIRAYRPGYPYDDQRFWPDSGAATIPLE